MTGSTLIPVRAVAERLGCSPKTVRALARSGRLPAVRFGERGWFRFDPSEVEQLARPETEDFSTADGPRDGAVEPTADPREPAVLVGAAGSATSKEAR